MEMDPGDQTRLPSARPLFVGEGWEEVCPDLLVTTQVAIRLWASKMMVIADITRKRLAISLWDREM
jgi:hypothetical protein